MTRTLVLVRHARAESYAASDHERPLSDRGLGEAAEAGTWLAGRGVSPERALVSDARRTRETWDALASAAGWSLEPTLDSALYESGVDTVLDVVRSVPPEVATLLVLGHNPTTAYLAQVLDAGGAPELATTGFPTAAVAVFEYDGPWDELSEGAARLVAVHVGAG